jgi:hypothetical protein
MKRKKTRWNGSDWGAPLLFGLRFMTISQQALPIHHGAAKCGPVLQKCRGRKSLDCRLGNAILGQGRFMHSTAKAFPKRFPVVDIRFGLTSALIEWVVV